MKMHFGIFEVGSRPVIVRLSSGRLTCETSQKGYFMTFYGFHITCKYGSIDVVALLTVVTRHFTHDLAASKCMQNLKIGRQSKSCLKAHSTLVI